MCGVSSHSGQGQWVVFLEWLILGNQGPLCLGSQAASGCEDSAFTVGSVPSTARGAVPVPGLHSASSALPAAELTEAHFGGGGLLQKTSQQPGQDEERPRSRKELIEELIAKSKQEKVRWSHPGFGAAVTTHAERFWGSFPRRICS